MTDKNSTKTISTSEKLQNDYLKYFSQQQNAVKPNEHYNFEIADEYDYSSKVERHIGTGTLAVG